jgi:hypothetical protein
MPSKILGAAWTLSADAVAPTRSDVGEFSRELRWSAVEDLEDRIAALERIVAEQRKLIETLEDAVTQPAGAGEPKTGAEG